MPVMGLWKTILSSRWQLYGYGRGYNLVDGSNRLMEEDKVSKVPVMWLWKRIQSSRWQ